MRLLGRVDCVGARNFGDGTRLDSTRENLKNMRAILVRELLDFPHLLGEYTIILIHLSLSTLICPKCH